MLNRGERDVFLFSLKRTDTLIRTVFDTIFDSSLTE